MTFRFLLPAAIGCALLGLQPANANIGIFGSAEVNSTVTNLGGGQFLYSYSVFNNRGCTTVGCNIAPFDTMESTLTDFYLPLFPDPTLPTSFLPRVGPKARTRRTFLSWEAAPRPCIGPGVWHRWQRNPASASSPHLLP